MTSRSRGYRPALVEAMETRRMLAHPRWESTATNGNDVGFDGDGITLTFSVVPDGTPLGSFMGEPNTPSSLRSILTFRYGPESNWATILQNTFNAWSAVTGVTYQYVGDDGAAFPHPGGSPGVLGARGDVRIGAHPIDGVAFPPNSSVLGYNRWPADGGDMVLDSEDLLFGPTASPVEFVNTLLHEHGHGLGLEHTLPQNSTKLMEPALNANFVGPQFDDIYRAQGLYGDTYEKGNGNDEPLTAVQLGTNPAANIGRRSLAGAGDQDWFKFTVSAGKRIDIIADPEGSPYTVAEVGDTPILFDPRTVADMKLELQDETGAIIGTSDIPGTGNMESIGMDLSAGTYYAKIFRPVPGNTQMYSLSVQTSEGAPVATIAPVSPDPRTSPVGSMTISFNKPVNGFDLSDLTLSRDGNATALAGATLTTSDNQTFTLNNLSATTDRVGTFTLTLNAAGSGITSQVGNVAMIQNASESWQMTQVNGTSGNDYFVLVRDGSISNRTNVYLNTVFQYWFLNNASMLMSASMGGGQDTFELDYTSGPMLPSNFLGFDGGTESDLVGVLGTNSNEAYSVSAGQLTFGAGSIVFGTTETVSLSMSGGNDSATILATTGTLVTVNGGFGNDSVTFASPAANMTLAASNTGFTSNTTEVTITGGVEQAYMQGNSNPGVTLSAFATAPLRPLTITGGDADEQFRVVQMNAANFPSGVTINGSSAGNDQLTATDQSFAGNSTYAISSGQLQKNNGFAGITYSNLDSVNVVAETGDNTVTINSTVGLPVIVDGSSGIDTVIFNEPTAGSLMRAYFNQFFSETTSVNHGNFESAQMIGNANPANWLVGSSAFGCPISVTGGTSTDNFRLENTTAALYQVQTTINGGGGANDILTVDDRFTNGDLVYTINSISILKNNGFGGVSYSNLDRVHVIGQTGSNQFNVTTGSLCPVQLGGSGSQDSYNVLNTGTSAPVIIDSAVGNDVLNVNLDNAGQGLAQISGNQRFGAINIGNFARADVLAGTNSTITTGSLSVGSSASYLNLFNNDLIVDYTGASQLAAVQALINQVRAGGAWNGAFGIHSWTARDNPQHSTTLGAMEATDYKSIYGAGAAFNGQAIDNTAILIKYTYYGDADFSGVVDFDDYVRADSGFNNNRGGWMNGDFDGSGVVDFDDYVLIDLAFNTQAGVL